MYKKDESKNETGNTMLQVENISHVFSDGRVGIRNVTLSIQKKDFLIIAGPNGSGKTTLLRHLNGLLTPSSGDIRLNGKSITRHITYTRKKIGMVFQDADAQIVGETVLDDTVFGPENLKMPRHRINEKANDTLGRLGLSHLKHRNPSTLSGGEKKRLAVAGVLVMNPEIILFDEPFSTLDFPGTVALMSLIDTLYDAGITIVIATHDIEKIISRATRMVIVDNGEIKADSTPEVLVKNVEEYGIREPCSSKLGMGIMDLIS